MDGVTPTLEIHVLRRDHLHYFQVSQEFNPLTTNGEYIHHEILMLWYHFQQCPWEIGSAWAVRVGQGEVGRCTWRVQTAWPCLGSALERSWLALGGPFLSSYARMGLENSPCRALFSKLKVFRGLDWCQEKWLLKIVNESVGGVTILYRIAARAFVWSLETVLDRVENMVCEPIISDTHICIIQLSACDVTSDNVWRVQTTLGGPVLFSFAQMGLENGLLAM